MRSSHLGNVQSAGAIGAATAAVEIGILTKGKPTLSMALVSLLLQEMGNIRIHIVDTGDSPAIKRDDVVFALRLAFDRGIPCGYEHIRERYRAFSVGRLKLLEALRGSNICFMDDDVVMASNTLSHMLPVAEANPSYGYITPYCKNAGFVGGPLSGTSHYSPGGMFYQDDVVRRILHEYYATTVDVLDEKKSRDKVWEIAFLTELFTLLGRRCIVQPENVTYHLDYRERLNNWDLDESRLVAASKAKAQEMVGKLG
ncbi:MAG: glycosyltransferase family 2 protein [Chloroflexi bacterium]|nr:glycosyltransferase family 2 protein [Chloroflexota bacterium]